MSRISRNILNILKRGIEMELYIVRHGRTKWNKIKRLQGNSDIPLAKEGRDMAAATALGLKDVHFDAIYASPLKRAYETAEIIMGERNISVQADDRLKEISFGVLEGKTINYLTDSHFFTHPERYITPENGESLTALCTRISAFLDDIRGKHTDAERIMIVAHGATNRALMKHIRNLDMKDFWSDHVQPNCGVTIIKIEDSGDEVIAEGKIFY
jgi:broad specificity phosphatase PhoE